MQHLSILLSGIEPKVETDVKEGKNLKQISIVLATIENIGVNRVKSQENKGIRLLESTYSYSDFSEK